jgi:large subunit ribosomal protein L10
MAITKEKKKEIVTDLEKVISKSKSVVFVNFHKLLVKDVSNIRRSLKNENIDYVVAKKSLFKRVLKNADIKGSVPALEGELALAFGEDLISPARSIYEFQRKLDGKVSIIGGIFDGEYKSQAEMLSIASIPSLDVLRGMFVNVINSPIQRFAIALNAIAQTKN